MLLLIATESWITFENFAIVLIKGQLLCVTIPLDIDRSTDWEQNSFLYERFRMKTHFET